MKVITLNIELDKHFDKFIPFIKEQNPDVACLQEVFEKDIDYLSHSLNMHHHLFSPATILPYKEKTMTPTGDFLYSKLMNHYEIVVNEEKGALEKYDFSKSGTLILSKHKIGSSEIFSYGDFPDKEIVYHDKNKHSETYRRNLTLANFVVNGKERETSFSIANIHFTWSGKGGVTGEQMRHYENLINFLSKKDLENTILCGDLNSPRGKCLYDSLSSILNDNVPKDCKTTIDKTLHRAGGLMLVVDCMFSGNRFYLDKAKVVGNVSDHMAIMCQFMLK